MNLDSLLPLLLVATDNSIESMTCTIIADNARTHQRTFPTTIGKRRRTAATVVAAAAAAAEQDEDVTEAAQPLQPLLSRWDSAAAQERRSDTMLRTPRRFISSEDSLCDDESYSDESCSESSLEWEESISSSSSSSLPILLDIQMPGHTNSCPTLPAVHDSPPLPEARQLVQKSASWPSYRRSFPPALPLWYCCTDEGQQGGLPSLAYPQGRECHLPQKEDTAKIDNNMDHGSTVSAHALIRASYNKEHNHHKYYHTGIQRQKPQRSLSLQAELLRTMTGKSSSPAHENARHVLQSVFDTLEKMNAASNDMEEEDDDFDTVKG